ncbi:MAG: ComEC/Rec2 family competence protein, partial [Spirochaetales bacterium]|nr:ComEC/Rec2 family competence protein [Spirochaetales bacterium]
ISKHMRQLQDDASAMGNLLLLGIGDGTSEQRIKQLAVESGCAHVLALSGMHLNVLSSLIASALGLLIGSRRAKLVTLIPSASYVWLVGYKPSLLRALCMQSYVAIRNDNDCADQALWFACIVQVYLTPYDMFSTGCLLSYSALAGILLYTEPIEALLRFVMPHCMAKALSVSLAALIFSAPIVLNVFGLWYPIGIIVGCLVAPLACLMLCLLFAWCLVPAPLLYKIIHVLTNIFLGIIDKASAWSNAHPSYSNYASLATVGSVLLTAALVLRYACACVRKRSMNRDGVGLPIRIGKSNRRIA